MAETEEEYNSPGSSYKQEEEEENSPLPQLRASAPAALLRPTGAAAGASASSSLTSSEGSPNSEASTRTTPVETPLPKGGNPNTILSRKLLKTYFQTFDYPFTRHHIDSFDQFLTQDLPAIIRANNPLLILKELIPNTEEYKYRVEIFVGGFDGTELQIGTPTVTLQKSSEVRVLFPNEARLRNLSYSSTVYAKVIVKITIKNPGEAEPAEPYYQTYENMPLFQIPILLHSRFCVLHGKPKSFLTEAGECPQDQGGYFIIDGAEKILITRQEQSFNTLYVTPQPKDEKIQTYANITCLSPTTRQVKVVSFAWNRSTDSLTVTLPFVRKPVPVFVLFRALGVQSDQDILELIYPDLQSSEAKQMVPLLLASIAESYPFLDQFSAIQFIKAMTKGFSETHVFDILFNQTFIHITDKRGISRAHFLADCVRKFMRVHTGIDTKTDRDDTRNQRCLTSGFLVRMLFNNAYATWVKATRLAIDKEYAYNAEIYSGPKFINIFSEGNTGKLFNLHLITEGLMRGFKGKWVTGGAGGGGALGHSDEKTGVLQALSRLSYLDFMSHCRRLNLNFDTSMKLTGPRQLHPSQYGYYCTNETPGGASIGVTKNFSLLTLVSTATEPDPLVRMLKERAWMLHCDDMRTDLLRIGVPVFLNNGIVGYTLQPFELTEVLKLMKWTGCLPALASISFSIRNRKIIIFTDEGRPVRPLIHLGKRGALNKDGLAAGRSWRDLVLGSFPPTQGRGISTTGIFDPLAETPGPIPLTQYKELLEPHIGLIEYIDPYEQNEAFIVNFAEHITNESSHMEIHPCTIISVVNGMIPFANFNQSPRNQLSCSQSKQGLSLYATNFQNRYDNTANILCYGEAPLVRTLQYDVLGEGQMPYGHNLIMAIMPFYGYNQDDGIVFNLDSFQRGMFRNITYRSYETFEEVDKVAKTVSIIANPLQVPQWTSLNTGKDYSKLDERGIIKVGEYVDEDTIIVSKYLQDKSGAIKDASLTPQVWTSGRVESVVVVVDNQGHRLVKVRITQDRTPELGDKFSTRHGQKGTIGMLYRAHDMPRTAEGLVPDMIVNPHCIPSRMTIAQLMEMLFGEICYNNSVIGDATVFMSDASAPEAIGRVLEKQFAMERAGNHVLYDGISGKQMETTIFMGPVFGMRLKHMVEDKWNARAEGRREQRTHQPTGGRGAQGGLRIGEMERDALAGHGIASFLRESMMERSDGTQFRICNGCGTVPIFNARQNLFVCPLCDGPVTHIGSSAQNMEILPPVKRSIVTTSVIEIPYATKLLAEELQTYMNMGMRLLTAKGLTRLREPLMMDDVKGDAVADALAQPLPERVFPETRIPEYREPPKDVEVAEENLVAMGLVQQPGEQEEIDALEEAEAEAAMEGAAVAASAAAGPPPSGAVAGAAPLALLPPAGAAAPAQQQQQVVFAGVPQQLMVAAPAPAQAPPLTQAQGQVQQGGSEPQAPPPLPPQPQQNTMPNVQYVQQLVPATNLVTQPVAASFTQVPMMMTQAVPGANVPPTIVVDTSPAAMSAGGFVQPLQQAVRGIPVMGGGSGGGARRHTTPRARGPATVNGHSAPSAHVKITVTKSG